MCMHVEGQLMEIENDQLFTRTEENMLKEGRCY